MPTRGPVQRGALASVAALVLPLACAPDPVLLRDDQVALALTLDADGALLASHWVDPSGLHVGVVGDQTLIVLTLDRGAFDYRGAGSWHEHRPTVVLDDGACAVCLLPQVGTPQPVLPGESCPIPADAVATVHEVGGGTGRSHVELVADVRARARLEWGRPLCPRIGRLATPNGTYGSTFDGWLDGLGAPLRTIQRTADVADVPFDDALLGELDLLLVEWPRRTFTSTEARALARWVEAGGGIVATSGFERDGSEPGRVNSLFAALDVAFQRPPRTGPVATFDAHPVTRGVDFLDFHGGYVITSTGAIPLATTVDGDVSVALERGAGRVVLWGDEWILANFSFEGMSDAQTFWANAVAWVGAPLSGPPRGR